MNSWMRNQLIKLYNAVSTPVAATRDALAERLQSIRETASLLYKGGGKYGYGSLLYRMVENIGSG